MNHLTLCSHLHKTSANAFWEINKQGLKTTNVQQLHELQREYLGNKNKD